MKLERLSRNIRQKPGVIALVAISLGIGVFTGWHAVVNAEPFGRLVMAVSVGVVLSGLLLAGAAWLLVGQLTAREAHHIVAWVVIGFGSIAVLAGVTIIYERGHGTSIAHPILVSGWIAGGGAIGGFLTGTYDVFRERECSRVEATSQRLRSIMETTPVAIVTLDEDGTVTEWSGTAEEMFGWERSEVVGDPHPIVPDDRRAEFEAHLQQVTGGEMLSGVETRRQHRDGSLVDVRLSSAPIEGPDGETTDEHVVALADISDQIERQRDLRLLQRAIEQAEDAVIITDQSGKIVYVNDAFEKMSGYGREEALGEEPSILKSGEHDESFYADLWETILDGEVWQAEVTNRRKTGELYEVEQTIAPIETNGEITHFVAIERDVTDRKRTEQRLNVLNRILRHNVRNAITVVQSNLDRIDDELDDDYSVQIAISNIEHRLTDLQSTTEKARIVKQSLDVDQKGPMHLATILRSKCNAFRGDDAPGHLEVDVPDDLWVVTNSTIETALGEAIENAFEHSQARTPTVRVSASAQSEERIALRIADDGGGIPDYERKVVENGGETALEHGSGIGLWLMKWVVNSVGGEVTIQETPDGGTAVTFTLPRAEPPESN
ncbi:MAG: PAS domain S-box-containing protein [Haloarculaceae archaeon]|jgi:PAS domain S-box-containing protein